MSTNFSTTSRGMCNHRVMNMRLTLMATLGLVILGSLGLTLSLRGAVGGGATPAPGDSVVPVTRLLAGQGSCHESGRVATTLSDLAAWSAWFRKATCGAELSLPELDFSSVQVLAVRGAIGPNGCYHVRITSVTEAEGGGYEVTVSRYVPTASMLCSMAMVQPVDAVSVPRLTGPVHFLWRTVSAAPPADSP